MDWTVRAEGDQVQVEVRQKDDGRGLYKAYLHGHAGRFALGTMMPEGNALVIRRRVEVSALRGCGVWPVTGAESELSFPFPPNGTPPEGWEVPRGRIAFCDAALDAAAAACSGALFCAVPTGFRLSFPYGAGTPFPMPALFCFARVRRVDGQMRVVYQFDRAGRPVFQG